MSQKHFNINTFIAILVITAVVAGWGIIYFGAKDIPYQHRDVQLHSECDAAYQDAEYVIDSLCDRVTELEAQLAGCEFQEHSKLTEYAAQ